jgi:GR25 family glycosyltransferase involved in LPS biosynthesis
MVQEFHRVGFPAENIERFEAIDGISLDKYNVTMKEEAYFTNSDFRRSKHRPFLIGNQLSHLRIMEEMVRNRTERVVICQDDLVLADDFTGQLKLVLDTIPSTTEFINIGFIKFACGKRIIGYDLKQQNMSKNPQNRHYDESDPTRPYIGLVKARVNPCSTAYIITLKGAQEFTKHIYENGCARATDWNFTEYLIKKGINYCSKYILATVTGEFGTDIF